MSDSERQNGAPEAREQRSETEASGRGDRKWKRHIGGSEGGEGRDYSGHPHCPGKGVTPAGGAVFVWWGA